MGYIHIYTHVYVYIYIFIYLYLYINLLIYLFIYIYISYNLHLIGISIGDLNGSSWLAKWDFSHGIFRQSDCQGFVLGFAVDCGISPLAKKGV